MNLSARKWSAATMGDNLIPIALFVTLAVWALATIAIYGLF